MSWMELYSDGDKVKWTLCGWEMFMFMDVNTRQQCLGFWMTMRLSRKPNRRSPSHKLFDHFHLKETPHTLRTLLWVILKVCKLEKKARPFPALNGLFGIGSSKLALFQHAISAASDKQPKQPFFTTHYGTWKVSLIKSGTFFQTLPKQDCTPAVILSKARFQTI